MTLWWFFTCLYWTTAKWNLLTWCFTEDVNTRGCGRTNSTPFKFWKNPLYLKNWVTFNHRDEVWNTAYSNFASPFWCRRHFGCSCSLFILFFFLAKSMYAFLLIWTGLLKGWMSKWLVPGKSENNIAKTHKRNIRAPWQKSRLLLFVFYKLFPAAHRQELPESEAVNECQLHISVNKTSCICSGSLMIGLVIAVPDDV